MESKEKNIERHKNEKWLEVVSSSYHTILQSLKYDGDIIPQLPDHEHSDVSDNTPIRAAKAFDFLTSGYRMEISDAVGKGVFESEGADPIVLVRDIEFYSLCEHHMLPFFGRIHVGYIPGSHILGLSKIPRIVDMFARRLQLQERLTMNVAEGIREALSPNNSIIADPNVKRPKGIAVVCEASHMCMAMRGVQKQNSTTISNAMLGVFMDEAAARAEFMSMLKG